MANHRSNHPSIHLCTAANQFPFKSPLGISSGKQHTVDFIPYQKSETHPHPPHRNNNLHWDLYPRLTPRQTKTETPAYNPSLGVLLAFPNLGSLAFLIMFLEVKHFGSFETSSPFKFVPRVEKCFHRELEKRMQYMTIRDSKKTVVNMLRMKNTPFTVCFTTSSSSSLSTESETFATFPLLL